MPWKEEKPVFELRYEFVKAHESGLYSMADLCRRFGVSRNNGYKWLKRYRESGLAGLQDQSKRPKSSPFSSSEEVVDAILEVRDAHPRWGARTIKAYLERYEPDRAWPSRSGLHKILKRSGRVREQKRRRKYAHPGYPVVAYDQPNRVWSADYKGQFRLGDGSYCYPLTVLDGHSRYLLGCQALQGTTTEAAREVFRRLFQEYGLPEFILTDNGVPFASPGLSGLSALSVWWIKLGILPKRTQPSHPEQNGRHERMHKTLKAEATRPPGQTLAAQQQEFDHFRRVFNEERPHHALELRTPADLYQPSPRPYPSRLPLIEYPSEAKVRLVSKNGGIRWKSEYLFVSQTLAQEHVALEEVEDGVWSIYFGPVELGRLNERNRTIS